MMRTTCTCYLDDGETPCHRMDVCTQVKTTDARGRVLMIRWACAECRVRIKLPEHDTTYRPPSVGGLRKLLLRRGIERYRRQRRSS